MKRFVFSLVLGLAVAGCTPNYVPFYMTGKIELMAETRRQQEYDYYHDKFVQRRSEFERQLDAFYINSLMVSAKEGVLTPEGVTYLNQKETELRAEFDNNEREALEKLRKNLQFYDDVIDAQLAIRSSILNTEMDNAKTFDKLSAEIASSAAELERASAARRSEYLDSADGTAVPVAPATDPPNIDGGTVQ